MGSKAKVSAPGFPADYVVFLSTRPEVLKIRATDTRLQGDQREFRLHGKVVGSFTRCAVAGWVREEIPEPADGLQAAA